MLTQQEKQDFVNAVIALKNPALAPNPAAAASRIPAAATRVTSGGGTPNRYDDYVWMHNVVGGGAHRGPAFGPWHREFLRQLEYDLQQVSGKPDITIPYWDWIVDRTPGDPGWPFTPDFMGGFGNATTGLISTGEFADPAKFRINIRLPGDGDLILKRQRGIPPANLLPVRADVLHAIGVGVAPGDPWPSVYDAAPFHAMSFTQALVDAAFRKYLEVLLHDGVHGWIGGAWDFVGGIPQNGGHMSFVPVAVNEPAFWLHHCMVDRLWAIWQRKSPTPAHIPPPGTANAGHNGPNVMIRFDNPAHFNTPVRQHPIDVQDHQAIGYSYHTDPPQITLSTPSVNFGDVPEQLTTYRPIQFAVRTCQPVTFTVTGVTGGNFSSPPAQGSVIVDHSHTSDVVTADIYVAFQALGALGVPQAGTAMIQATIVDRDGYDAPNPGDVHVVGMWAVDLLATPVTRPRAAVALVLDRSGSMAQSAGAAGTKYDLLKSSLDVVADVMRDIDGLGIVTFDDLVATLNGIQEMGPNVMMPVPGTGRRAAEDAIASPELVPRGLTGIGQGMISSAAVLDAERTAAGTPYAQFAMLVMTDGNQNVAPSVLDPPVTAAIAPYANSVYAIGLGTPGNVSDTTLGQIANYMLVTGDITAAERRFRLTKYFIQILAGVTRTMIITDPQGDLLIGSEHVIPFFVAETDVEMDVIALCPIAPFLELELETPDGTRITSGFGAPTVNYFENTEDTFYRLTLPLDPGIRHEGEWKAILRLTEESIRRNWRDLERFRHHLEQLRKTGGLPYSLLVQSYSNLELAVYPRPTALLAGESVTLLAVLTEYGQPLLGAAEVVVQVTDPRGSQTSVALDATGSGTFTGNLSTTLPGVYFCRFLATGRTVQGQIFTREETRTISAFADRIPDGSGSGEDDNRDRRGGPPMDVAELLRADRGSFCRLIQSVIEDEVLAERVGLDRERAKVYFERYCRDQLQ
ncbi:MAG: tyrosinase family protein [Pseudonocardiaceae bacterium]